MKSTVYFRIATILFLVSTVMSLCGPFISAVTCQAITFVLGWSLLISGWVLIGFGIVNLIRRT